MQHYGELNACVLVVTLPSKVSNISRSRKVLKLSKLWIADRTSDSFNRSRRRASTLPARRAKIQISFADGNFPPTVPSA